MLRSHADFRRTVGPQVFLALLTLAIALSATKAQAFVDRIKPGEIEELDADQGLLLVGIDSDTNLPWVRLKRLDGYFTTVNLRQLESGRTTVLYALPAGEYQWIKVRTYAEYDLADDPEFHFTVRPGRINYAGDLVVRPQSLFRTLFHVTNRGLAGMDWLRANHRALADRYPFEYTGHYPDPFPAFYTSEYEGWPLTWKKSDNPL